MRVNKYKISKKRRLRRRGKYSKKLKTKSRKSGGRFTFLGHVKVKNKVKISATCEIPEFFFTSHDLFYDIMGLSEDFRLRKTVYGEPPPGIDISVYGVLLGKNKTPDDSYTLSVKLNSPATIDVVYFNILQEHDRVTPHEKKLDIDVTDSMIFNVKKVRTYKVSTDGKGWRFPTPIECSEYEATEPEEFVVHDRHDHILKWLLHLWRKKYTDPTLKRFDDFFSDFCTQQPNIVNLFRKHTYIFKVKHIILSSS